MRSLQFLRLAWVNVCIFVTLLVVMELLAMAYYAVRDPRAFFRKPEIFLGAPPTTYAPGSPEFLSYHEASLIAPHWTPFAYWRMDPFHGRYTNIESDGHRRTWSPAGANAAQQRVKVWVIGGSTIWGLGAGDDQTIPSHLAKVLDSQFPSSIEVVNLGQPAYVSTQEVIGLLRELQSGARPDLVVFYDGFNDTWTTLPGKAGVTLREDNREQEFDILNPDHSGRLYLELLKRRYLYKALQNVARRVRGGAKSDAPAPEKADSLASEIVRIYSANVRSVEGLGKEFGFTPLFYWQPVVFSKKTPSAAEKAIEAPLASWNPLFHATYERAKQAPSTNLSNLFDSTAETMFLDSCHVTEPANETIARRIAQDVAPLVSARLTKR